MAQSSNFDCSSKCRRLAAQAFELADEGQPPEIARELSTIASQLLLRAKLADAGDPYLDGEMEYGRLALELVCVLELADPELAEGSLRVLSS